MEDQNEKHSEILADLLDQNVSEDELLLLLKDLQYIFTPTDFDDAINAAVGRSFYIEAPEQRLN